jgi:hypothetical protein
MLCLVDEWLVRHSKPCPWKRVRDSREKDHWKFRIYESTCSPVSSTSNCGLEWIRVEKHIRESVVGRPTLLISL